MFDFLKKLFGTKSEKDVKALESRVDEINNIYTSLNSISNDELRAKSNALKQKIKTAIKSQNDEITAIKSEVDSNPDIDVNKKEELYKQIDEIEKDITKQIETVLSDLLPEAFAILKETARRFKENSIIEVTANDFDKELSKNHKNVIINNGKASYQNKWLAAGNEITWDMVHYNVQLIGGMVLHQGKISEMATGEGKTLVSTLPIFLNGFSLISGT